MNTRPLLPLMANEVKKTLSQMHPNKSPYPVGFSPIFFQKYWNIVDQDISHFVLSFLNNGVFNSQVNFARIVLIPKCKIPDQISQFRPISLCNVVYKVASKVLLIELGLFA